MNITACNFQGLSELKAGRSKRWGIAIYQQDCKLQELSYEMRKNMAINLHTSLTMRASNQAN